MSFVKSVIGGVLGGLFGGNDAPAPAAAVAPPAPAVVAPPPVMPVPDDKAVKMAARARLAKQNATRTSRDSTILTGGDTDLLGG